jgi:hypothetical protein
LKHLTKYASFLGDAYEEILRTAQARERERAEAAAAAARRR